MYIPVDKETTFVLPTGDGRPTKRPVLSVSTNREKTLVAVITEDAVYIWLSHPQLLLCTLALSENEILEKGNFRKVYWRYDSSCIAVSTSLNHIMIYRVDISDDNCYNFTDSQNSAYHRSSQELFLRGGRPAVALYPAVIVNLAAPATCCVPLREELLVCVKNGFCHHITWEGAVRTDYSIRLANVPFAHDQLQSKPEYIHDPTVHIVDAVYAPLTGGYCIVLSDGRAALLTSSDSKFHPNSLLGVWVQTLKDAICTDVNHKFRLLTFGCKNGDLVGFHLDDTNGSLVQTFRISVSVKDGPEIGNRIGPCTRVSVLPNGAALTAIWDTSVTTPTTSSTETKTNGVVENGESGEETTHPVGLPPIAAIFTPFGSQLWCSLEGVAECDSPPALSYTTVEWGTEGYQLWLGRTDGLSLLPLTRLAASCNPVMEQHDRVVLISGSRILVSPPREREAKASAPHAVWASLRIPNEYISANWPIRFACLDAEGKTLVVAGQRGIAHCNLVAMRWKIFGNESQERDLIVTGGVFLWKGTVGVACCESDSARESIRFFPLATKLDNRFASTVDPEARILMLSTRDDALVTFDVESRIILYKMRRTDNPNAVDSYPRVAMDVVAEIRVGDLIPHPACLVSLQLTQLNLDPGGGQFLPGVDTVLVNVSGKLITLNPKNTSKDDEERFQLNQPIMVASFVEQMWHDRARSSSITPASEDVAHLVNALWINCGSKGMKVWLPLLPGRRSQAAQDTTFISKRIMLPYELGIYPVVICSSDCLAIGVEAIRMQLMLHGGKQMTYYNLHRNSEVFVHHLLRQLLKRNLGMFALEVAGACRPLPHFSHSLELLLHGVLEEEATSSEPIPDPLLPRCVAFIREFPEFLRTVAHCARKTELALWPALFAVTGSPNDLFEVCLRDGQLQTAASYLIVLQSIEHSQISQEQSVHLLREALSAGEWTIARDMVRFARSIDADDMDSPARSPLPPQQARRTTSMSLNNGEANELVFSRFQAAARVAKVRHSHDHKEGQRKDSTGSTRKVGRAMSNEMGPPSPTSASNPMAEKMDSILIEHGQRLLDEYCIRDLGSFCAHLCVDHRKIMSRHAVADFPVALTRLHSQFSWPYPVPGKHVVDQLEKKFGSMKVSKSTIGLSGTPEPVKPTPSRLSNVVENGHDSSPEAKSSQPNSDETTTDSCSIEEAKLVPLNGERNGRASPESTTTPAAVDTPDTRSTNGDWQGVEVLVGEATSRGPSTSQLQLATMLQLFSDAGAIDWVFLLCLVSRDVTRLRQEINASAVSNKWGVEAFGQTRLGCIALLNWATTNCLGYVSVLQVFNAHLDVVSEQAGCLNLPPPAANGRATSRRDNKVIPPPDREALRAAQLNNSFRGRERSRSVDRLPAANANEAEEGVGGEGCILM